MRVTHRMVAETTIRNMRTNLDKLESLQDNLTTGHRITRPSDDPVAVAQTLSYKSSLAAGETYLRTIDDSTSWLNATDGMPRSVPSKVAETVPE